MDARPRLAVVVLSYNGLDDTRKCLRSLEPAMRPWATAILVDNGSTDGTAAAVAVEFAWCRLERVEENRGPAGGNNAGLKAALDTDADWIVLLNNDTIVDKTLLDRLREAALAHPDYAVIGPVIKFMDSPDVVMTDGCIFNPAIPRGFFLQKPVPLTRHIPPAITAVDIVNGCCMMIKGETVRRIGPFDERIFMYHDELDLCLRVKAAGEKAGVIDHALVWHKGSATSRATGKQSIRYFDARNLWYVLKKHKWAGHNGRSRWRTTLIYVRYMYYWYCAELEEGNEKSATAVVAGICDGLTGQHGPYVARRRRLFAPIRGAFELLRRRPRFASRRASSARPQAF